MSDPLIACLPGVTFNGCQSQAAESSNIARFESHSANSSEKTTETYLVGGDDLNFGKKEGESKSLDGFQIKAAAPATESGIKQESDIESAPYATTLSGANPEDVELSHKHCPFPGHSDSCWNDPRWHLRNQEKRAADEKRLQSGHHQFKPDWCWVNESRNQKYQGEGRFYQGSSYSNIKITKRDDSKVIMNINRNCSEPLCRFFERKNQDWALSGYSYMAPVLVNLTEEKTYEQRGDHYDPFELIWLIAEASPDGNTLLARGEVWGGFPEEYRFYNFSNPDEGFRYLKSPKLLVHFSKRFPLTPIWEIDKDNKTTVTLMTRGDDVDSSSEDDVDSEDDDDYSPLYAVTLRREEDQMIELERKLVKTEGNELHQ